MNLTCTKTSLPDVILLEPAVFADRRGYFMELHHRDKYAQCGIADPFVQDNMSFSQKGVLRGLHYQLRFPQGKLISVLSGEIFDVAVDIRRNSPTFGEFVSAVLSAENHRQLYVPPGFAHGFCVTSETAQILYKCTDVYHPNDDFGVHWSDAEISIPWPVSNPVVSDKDAGLPCLNEIRTDQLFE